MVVGGEGRTPEVEVGEGAVALQGAGDGHGPGVLQPAVWGAAADRRRKERAADRSRTVPSRCRFLIRNAAKMLISNFLKIVWVIPDLDVLGN